MTFYAIVDGDRVGFVEFEDGLKEYFRHDLDLANGLGSYLACSEKRFVSSPEESKPSMKMFIDNKWDKRIQRIIEDELHLLNNNEVYKMARVKDTKEILRKLKEYERSCSRHTEFKDGLPKAAK